MKGNHDPVMSVCRLEQWPNSRLDSYIQSEEEYRPVVLGPRLERGEFAIGLDRCQPAGEVS